MRKTRLAIGLGAFALILGVVAWTRNGPRVVLRNESGEVLRSIHLEYVGGNSVLANLSDTESVSISISPSGESNLRIHFQNANGIVQHRELDCYFEPGYATTFQIRFSAKDEVFWRQKHGLFPGKPEEWSENWKRSTIVEP